MANMPVHSEACDTDSTKTETDKSALCKQVFSVVDTYDVPSKNITFIHSQISDANVSEASRRKICWHDQEHKIHKGIYDTSSLPHCTFSITIVAIEFSNESSIWVASEKIAKKKNDMVQAKTTARTTSAHT